MVPTERQSTIHLRPSWPGLLLPLLVCLGLALLLAVAMFALEQVDRHYRQTVPLLDLTDDALMIAHLATVPMLVVLLIWKGRPRVRQHGPGFKVAYFGGAVLLQAVAVAGLAWYHVERNFRLFEARYLNVQARSPDRRKIAYLFERGLCCGYVVFVRRSGETAMKEVVNRSIKCEFLPESPALVWAADSSSVAVVASSGEQIPDQRDPCLDGVLGGHH